MDHLVSPSLLAADFGNLEKDVRMVNRSYADWLHLDIMDGVFVPNLSFGFPVIESVKRVAEKPLDVHLMIVDPDRYLQRFRDAGAFMLTVQYETCIHLQRTVTEIHNLGMKAGVALNPHTPVLLVKNILSIVDMVLIMTVNPGFGGQQFIKTTLPKIAKASQMLTALPHKPLLEVDGGVNLKNISGIAQAGADVLVAGAAIFGTKDYQKTITALKALANGN